MSLVSIILPNLNTNISFLKERVESILSQTYSNWECIVIDGFSSNGSWEYLEDVAKKDNRFKCFQFPKEGIYKAWNSGLEKARGSFIYIAPSDDTMSPEFLTEMVGGLIEQRECSIAHCCLEIIDEQGKRSTKKNWDEFTGLRLYNNEVSKKHIRYAPLDGILYSAIGPVYTSITQLLIKKEVFDKVGFFLTDHGPIADFEWGMRASLVFNTLHIPKYLATWRVHKDQATDDTLSSGFLFEKYVFFIKHALQTNQQKGLLNRKYNVKELQYNYSRWELVSKVNEEKSIVRQVRLVASFMNKYPVNSVIDISKKLLGFRKEGNVDFIKKKIVKFNLLDNVKVI